MLNGRVHIFDAPDSIEAAKKFLWDQEADLSSSCSNFEQCVQHEQENFEQAKNILSRQLQHSKDIVEKAKAVSDSAKEAQREAKTEMDSWDRAVQITVGLNDYAERVAKEANSKLDSIRKKIEQINQEIGQWEKYIMDNDREIESNQKMIKLIYSRANTESDFDDARKAANKIKSLQKYNREYSENIRNLSEQTAQWEAKKEQVLEFRIKIQEVSAKVAIKLSEAQQGRNIAQTNLACADNLYSKADDNLDKAGQAVQDDESHQTMLEMNSRNAMTILEELKSAMQKAETEAVETINNASSALTGLIDFINEYLGMSVGH